MIKIPIILHIVASLLMLSGAFYSIEFLKVISLAIFGICLCVFFILILGKKNTLLNMDAGTFILFISSFLILLVSSVLNSAIDLFFGILLYIFLVVNFCSFHVDKYCFQFFDSPIKLVFIVITILNIINNDFSIPFKGIFSNPNSLGGIYATLAFISTGILLDKVTNNEKEQIKIDYYLLIIIILSIIFTLISNSRISFFSAILCFILLGICFFIQGLNFSFNKNKLYMIRIKISLLRKMMIILFPIFSIIFILRDDIENIFIRKILYKAYDSTEGITDGRYEVWKIIIDNSSILGHGRYSPHLEYLNLSAHNTFFSIYDQFGWLGCVSFSIVILVVIFNICKPNNIKRYGMTPVFICLSFLLLSISESMINKTSFFCLLMVTNLNSFKKLVK